MADNHYVSNPELLKEMKEFLKTCEYQGEWHKYSSNEVLEKDEKYVNKGELQAIERGFKKNDWVFDKNTKKLFFAETDTNLVEIQPEIGWYFEYKPTNKTVYNTFRRKYIVGSGKPSQKLSKMIWLISDGLSKKSNFCGYTWREEMVSFGFQTSLSYLGNFDPNKSNNPFAYISNICFRAFLMFINKEKKHSTIKDSCVNSCDGIDYYQEDDSALNYADNMNTSIPSNSKIIDRIKHLFEKNKHEQLIEMYENEDWTGIRMLFDSQSEEYQNKQIRYNFNVLMGYFENKDESSMDNKQYQEYLKKKYENSF